MQPIIDRYFVSSLSFDNHSEILPDIFKKDAAAFEK